MINKIEIEEIFNRFELVDYKWINAKEIIVSNWVRVKCTFGCPDYGLSVCPPNVPDVELCKTFFLEYDRAILIRFNFLASKDNYPKEYAKKITNSLIELEKQVFLLGYPKAFIFNQTCCGICPECSDNRINCKNLLKSRPSMEAFAVDVFSTVRNNGFDIDIVGKKESEINRYALLMVA